MTKIVFLTAPSNDCYNHVAAFRSIAPAEHVIMDFKGIRLDWEIVESIRKMNPNVVFYIGANEGTHALKWKALKEISRFAKTVNICSDAADKPWHNILENYKNIGCFDLQVSIDGGRPSTIDLPSLTPIDSDQYQGEVNRDIRCGFSGSTGGKRSEIINALSWFGNLTVRNRAAQDGYAEHVEFLKRCRMLLNTSWTGSGQTHHIKGRVLEAGWAGCALLEYHESPIKEWFPDDCYFIWRDAKEAAAIIKDASDDDISRRSRRLAEEVRARFSAKSIYGEILRKINVDIAQ